MIKLYKMALCPDCSCLEEQLKGNDKIEVIDIGESPRKLKEFLRMRDTEAVFKPIKASGSIGIPCFVLEDGTISFSPEDAGLMIPSVPEPVEGPGHATQAPATDSPTQACSLSDRRGC